MARGLGAHYGADTGADDRRRPAEGGTASGWAAAGGGTNSPYDPGMDYLPVTGSPGMYYTPDRMMQVGIGREEVTPPQSEQAGRGIFVGPQFDEFAGGDFGAVSQTGPNSELMNRLVPPAPAVLATAPQQEPWRYESYGMYPEQMTDIINRTRTQET